jgi:hypothetical protein
MASKLAVLRAVQFRDRLTGVSRLCRQMESLAFVEAVVTHMQLKHNRKRPKRNICHKLSARTEETFQGIMKRANQSAIYPFQCLAGLAGRDTKAEETSDHTRPTARQTQWRVRVCESGIIRLRQPRLRSSDWSKTTANRCTLNQI